MRPIFGLVQIGRKSYKAVTYISLKLKIGWKINPPSISSTVLSCLITSPFRFSWNLSRGVVSCAEHESDDFFNLRHLYQDMPTRRCQLLIMLFFCYFKIKTNKNMTFHFNGQFDRCNNKTLSPRGALAPLFKPTLLSCATVREEYY